MNPHEINAIRKKGKKVIKNYHYFQHTQRTQKKENPKSRKKKKKKEKRKKKRETMKGRNTKEEEEERRTRKESERTRQGFHKRWQVSSSRPRGPDSAPHVPHHCLSLFLHLPATGVCGVRGEATESHVFSGLVGFLWEFMF